MKIKLLKRGNRYILDRFSNCGHAESRQSNKNGYCIIIETRIFLPTSNKEYNSKRNAVRGKARKKVNLVFYFSSNLEGGQANGTTERVEVAGGTRFRCKIWIERTEKHTSHESALQEPEEK